MPLNIRTCWGLGLCAGAAALLAACQPALPAVPLTRVTTPATPTAVVAPSSTPLLPASPPPPTSTVTLAPSAPAAAVVTRTVTPAPALTVASQPAISTSPAASTAVVTATEAPATGTPRPATATPAAATATSAAAATQVPVTFTPTATNAPPSLYSTTGGPAGYSSRIQCQRAGAPCAPVMAPGDFSFQLSLASDVSAPWTHFVNYGLSVEKDGANVAELFMFVDAGWLHPGAAVGFGASRAFTQPGAYVIRSSGCLTTASKGTDCVWATIAGDVVNFTIQP